MITLLKILGLFNISNIIFLQLFTIILYTITFVIKYFFNTGTRDLPLGVSTPQLKPLYEDCETDIQRFCRYDPWRLPVRRSRDRRSSSESRISTSRNGGFAYRDFGWRSEASGQHVIGTSTHQVESIPGTSNSPDFMVPSRSRLSNRPRL